MTITADLNREGFMTDEEGIGERMKIAANAVGLSSGKLGELFGVSGSTVRAWWIGRNKPPIDVIRRYAEAVATTTDYLLYGKTEPYSPTAGWKTLEEAVTDSFAEFVYKFAELVMQGQPPGDTVEVISGKPITEERRVSLNRRAVQMRRYLSELAGRPWAELSAEERQQTVERLLKEVGE